MKSAKLRVSIFYWKVGLWSVRTFPAYLSAGSLSGFWPRQQEFPEQQLPGQNSNCQQQQILKEETKIDHDNLSIMVPVIYNILKQLS